jgi:hypothetical protein
MLMVKQPGKVVAHDPDGRGYRVAYHTSYVNYCPGCGRTHWYIGRVSAECAFCSTALPLIQGRTEPDNPVD